MGQGAGGGGAGGDQVGQEGALGFVEADDVLLVHGGPPAGERTIGFAHPRYTQPRQPVNWRWQVY